MIGTDRDILGSKKKERKQGAGRPRVDEDLIIRNMKLVDANGVRRYTDRQLASMAGCSDRSIRRIRERAIAAGTLEPENADKKGLGIVEAELDAECIRAKGYSFKEWVLTRFKRPSSGNYVFNFTAKVWEQDWNKCSLVEFAGVEDSLADKCAMLFAQAYGEDRERMRRRIKQISYIFRFLGKEECRKRHLRLDNAKHPRSKRSVPEITDIQFGNKWNQIEDIVASKLGEEARLMIRFKVCSQMRTGDLKEGRELYGLVHGTEGQSYIKFFSEEQFIGHIFAKRSEEWELIWLPYEVRTALMKHLETIPEGDPIWSIPMASLRKVFGQATKQVTGRRMILHDMRKISVTWLYCLGVPADVACLLNVGWLDISTAFAHYLDARKLLRGSFKRDYSANIPDWFKEGLDDFKGEDANIPSSSGGRRF